MTTARILIATGLGAALAALTLVSPALAQPAGGTSLPTPSAFGLQFAWPDPPPPPEAPPAQEDCLGEAGIRAALAARGYEGVVLDAPEPAAGEGVWTVTAHLGGAPVGFLYDSCADLVLEAPPAP